MTSLAKSMAYYEKHIEQIKLDAQNGNPEAKCVVELVAIANHSEHNKNIVHLFTESMSAYIEPLLTENMVTYKKLGAEVKPTASTSHTEEINDVAFAEEACAPLEPKPLDISKMF
tara:strand:+ start:1191 stop:1535 length:345 start_codon:yes stop_codon:yes gene_type:complete